VADPAGGPEAARLFRFVQFEFPYVLGPAAGRYVLRDHADEDALRVLVVGVLGDDPRPRGGRVRRRRARPAAPGPDAAVAPVTRVTVVRGQRIGVDAARAWVADAAARVEPELAVVNRILHLHRVAAADPSVRPVTVARASAVRVGFGEGEQVAEGRWTEAVEPPRERQGARALAREAALRPQERLAALLGGRDAALACEALALDARAALDGDRPREAALTLRVALEAALAELEPWGDRGDLRGRLAELREQRGTVGDAANAALRGGLDEATAADVERIVGRIEAALRARSAAGWA